MASDSDAYTTITVDGRTSEICYAARPAAAAAQRPGDPGSPTVVPDTASGYQSMNVIVPESAPSVTSGHRSISR